MFLGNKMTKLNLQQINSILQRASYLTHQMIGEANSRPDVQVGDPKVGGHSSACASVLHIMASLHLFVRTGYDYVVNKPHASPVDHAFHYLLDLFLHSDLTPLTLEERNIAMKGLRAFPQKNNKVFQSYHSEYDPDCHNFLPSGTVGIPAVMAGYLAYAHKYVQKQGYEILPAHFWCVLGDSEFREGSLAEAVPDLAERQVGNLTWIIDYNRQSLDGHRILNPQAMDGSDSERIKKTMIVNGWEVIEVRHGQKRINFLNQPHVQDFKRWFENEMSDYELQVLLLAEKGSLKPYLQKQCEGKIKNLSQFLDHVSEEELYLCFHDFGGHDIKLLIQALEESKKNSQKPCCILTHTIKGWGLKMQAVSGNHSMLPNTEELSQLRKTVGLTEDEAFVPFSSHSLEGQFLVQRGAQLHEELLDRENLKNKNKEVFFQKFQNLNKENIKKSFPSSFKINFNLVKYPHTQWMLGQIVAKLTRIGNVDLKNEEEKFWQPIAQNLVSMSPDVGTSTNLNPAMDGHIFGAQVTPDREKILGVKDLKTPDLVPSEQIQDRFLRFDIAEANTMSCLGAYGRVQHFLGIPLIPIMTVYDFFIKRALDQYFYNLYWGSRFILVGTPSGVTLSPEGAQHCWKSDFQIPNQIVWEPFYCIELDWIMCESLRRLILGEDEKRSGVLIRGVTRGVDQKKFLSLLKTQKRFKQNRNALLSPRGFSLKGAVEESKIESLKESQILSQIRQEVLQGAYFLINYKGYASYEPGDNVVYIFAMGALGVEAVRASEELLQKGIYANVIIVTSPDLLLGNLAQENDYTYLKEGLEINADLYIHFSDSKNQTLSSPEFACAAGRRVPVVSVHDGEPGLLDNIGSIIGVRQETLAVRKHSLCGRPQDVYDYHGMNTSSIIAACEKVLSETALENVQVRRT